MANKVYNMAGGLHSASAYTAFENEALGGNAVASCDALRVSTTGGMKVTVAKGNALIRVDSELSRRVALTSPVDITITTADTTLPRKDLIVIYIDSSVTPTTDNQDNVNNILKLVAVKGIPNTSPQAPDDNAVLQAIGAGNPFIKLAQVTVPAGATNLSDDLNLILDVRPHKSKLYPASPFITIRPTESRVIPVTNGATSVPTMNKVTESSSNWGDYYWVQGDGKVKINETGVYMVEFTIGTEGANNVLTYVRADGQANGLYLLSCKSAQPTGWGVLGGTCIIPITTPGQVLNAVIEVYLQRIKTVINWTRMSIVRIADIYN